MSKTALAGAMITAMDKLSDADKADRRKTFEALAEAIIDHIKAHAQINGAAGLGLTSVSGGPVSGTVILLPGSIT